MFTILGGEAQPASTPTRRQSRSFIDLFDPTWAKLKKSFQLVEKSRKRYLRFLYLHAGSRVTAHDEGHMFLWDSGDS